MLHPNIKVIGFQGSLEGQSKACKHNIRRTRTQELQILKSQHIFFQNQLPKIFVIVSLYISSHTTSPNLRVVFKRPISITTRILDSINLVHLFHSIFFAIHIVFLFITILLSSISCLYSDNHSFVVPSITHKKIVNL